MDTRLIGAKSPLIGHAEIHMNMQDGHVMRMRAMAGGIELPAGETIELKPGGYHIMLFELNPAIDTAKTIPLTLVFAKGGEIEVEADVRPVSSN